MNERVKKLREYSLTIPATLSSERAVLMTQFYQQLNQLVSKPVERALSFAFLMEHKSIYIHPGELIVGEKGDLPKAAPTFPELCCHSLNDLEILDSREKIPFKVSSDTLTLFQNEIIPFWTGKTMRERIFTEMSDDWKAAYEAGIFTEFMEQRAPGHTVLDDKIYHFGMFDFVEKIDHRLQTLDYLKNPRAYDQQEELKAMRITALAIIRFAERHAEEAQRLALIEKDPQRKKELEKINKICRRVPGNKPETMHEALQYYWFVHLGVTTELNTWDAFDPGRLDQHLYPFYEKEIKTGQITHEQAEELLQCFWIKFNNQPAPPKVGVTAAESGTYTDFAQINLGGVQADGSDGVNEITYLLLDVVEEMRLLQPSASIQVSKKNPDQFITRAAQIIRTGFGQPSIFNADAIIQELQRMGKSLLDARNSGSSGCVEVGAFGKENYNLTGYFNIPKILELTLHNGLDPRTGKQLGPRTGDPLNFANFENLFEAFSEQMRYFIDIKVRGNQIIERLYARYMPCPFLSLLIDDCIEKAMDYHEGGARYNTTYIQGVGIGSITDQLSAIKTHVFEKNSLTMKQLLNALANNFEGHERTRQLLLNRTPRYGNDDEAADELMQQVFELFFDSIDGRPNTKGGTYHINLLPTTCHVYFGSVMNASPEGRLAGTPLSEGISPVQGADRKGPTAVLRSAAKLDHLRTGGTLLNQKFSPNLMKGEAGLMLLTQLVRAYFKMDGHHIQFNVVDAETLKQAQKNPQDYRDLIVRVAGYSDYFCDLSPALQNEIIQRTEHESF
ncbi:MAG: formate C-acetyltransferase/glycerol dehydratase family glycyl radical enzyme [Anaerolineaceae bacterium]|nr:formate C-acetyltransferase/glycerol dehydratase family glycyl radical enzyme [Anaerolineaceae bacterium]